MAGVTSAHALPAFHVPENEYNRLDTKAYPNHVIVFDYDGTLGMGEDLIRTTSGPARIKEQNIPQVLALAAKMFRVIMISYRIDAPDIMKKHRSLKYFNYVYHQQAVSKVGPMYDYIRQLGDSAKIRPQNVLLFDDLIENIEAFKSDAFVRNWPRPRAGDTNAHAMRVMHQNWLILTVPLFIKTVQQFWGIPDNAQNVEGLDKVHNLLGGATVSFRNPRNGTTLESNAQEIYGVSNADFRPKLTSDGATRVAEVLGIAQELLAGPFDEEQEEKAELYARLGVPM